MYPQQLAASDDHVACSYISDNSIPGASVGNGNVHFSVSWMPCESEDGILLKQWAINYI